MKDKKFYIGLGIVVVAIILAFVVYWGVHEINQARQTSHEFFAICSPDDKQCEIAHEGNDEVSYSAYGLMPDNHCSDYRLFLDTGNPQSCINYTLIVSRCKIEVQDTFKPDYNGKYRQLMGINVGSQYYLVCQKL